MPQGLAAFLGGIEHDFQPLHDPPLTHDISQALRAKLIIVAGIIGIKPAAEAPAFRWFRRVPLSRRLNNRFPRHAPAQLPQKYSSIIAFEARVSTRNLVAKQRLMF
jgi:hypothetical protein